MYAEKWDDARNDTWDDTCKDTNYHEDTTLPISKSLRLNDWLLHQSYHSLYSSFNTQLSSWKYLSAGFTSPLLTVVTETEIQEAYLYKWSSFFKCEGYVNGHRSIWKCSKFIGRRCGWIRGGEIREVNKGGEGRDGGEGRGRKRGRVGEVNGVIPLPENHGSVTECTVSERPFTNNAINWRAQQSTQTRHLWGKQLRQLLQLQRLQQNDHWILRRWKR